MLDRPRARAARQAMSQRRYRQRVRDGRAIYPVEADSDADQARLAR
jgi:hypothetical protein